MVWTRDLRPAGFPRVFGRDFFLAGYRIFTRLRDESGRNLRGLKIIRSETDQRGMVWSGNLLTRYHYRLIRLQIEEQGSATRVLTTLPDGRPTMDIIFDDTVESPPLPSGSPFHDWRDARRFAGPMPFTFSPEKDGSFIVIEGSRRNWTPAPVHVKNWKIGIFDDTPLKGTAPILANAFTVKNVTYRWQRGRIVKPGTRP